MVYGITGLQAFLVDQKKTFNDSLEVSKSAARVYAKYATTLETQGYFAGIECKLQLAEQAAQFYEEMKTIHEVFRSSSAMVCNEEALIPFRDFVVKVGDGVSELDKQRKTRLLDYDAHKRRHKALDDKSHSTTSLSTSDQNDLIKFAQKLKEDDEGIKMITDAEDDTIRRSKMEHDALMDDFVITLAVCQARFFNAAGERLNALVATLPPEKVESIQAKVDANIAKGGAMITDQKSAARVALDAAAGKTTVAEAATVFIGGAPPPPLPSNSENTTKGNVNLPNSKHPLLNFSSMGQSFFGIASEGTSEDECSSDIPNINKMERLDLSGANAPPAKPPPPNFAPPLPTPQGFAVQQAANGALPDPTFGPAYFPKDRKEDLDNVNPPLEDPNVVANSGDFSGYKKGASLFDENNDGDRDVGSNPFGPADDFESSDNSRRSTNPFVSDEDLSAPSESTPIPPAAPPPIPSLAPPARAPSMPLSAPPPIPTNPNMADVTSHLQEYIDPISSHNAAKRNSRGMYPRVVALYDSKPEESDELEFYKGDIIEVLKGDNEGWSKGMLRGVQGMFPSNYVEPYKD